MAKNNPSAKDAPAPAVEAPAPAVYRILTPVRMDGKRHAPGEEIELTEAVAAELLAIKAVAEIAAPSAPAPKA